MAKEWTVKEEQECSAIYSKKGAEEASKQLGRSAHSIYEKMRKLGVKSQHCNAKNLKSRTERKFFAEEISVIFELLQSGISYSIISEMFDTTASSIRGTVSIAKKNGFEAYPLRNSQ